MWPRAAFAVHPACLARQGEPGDLFYIIKEGEAVVYQDTGSGSRKRVNQLFKADFFGEGALLSDEPRYAGALRQSPAETWDMKSILHAGVGIGSTRVLRALSSSRLARCGRLRDVLAAACYAACRFSLSLAVGVCVSVIVVE